MVDVADGKDAVVCLAEVRLKGLVVAQAYVEVFDELNWNAWDVEHPEDGVDEVDSLLGRGARLGGGAGEGQGGQDACENGGGLHLDWERRACATAVASDVRWDWECGRCGHTKLILDRGVVFSVAGQNDATNE